LKNKILIYCCLIFSSNFIWAQFNFDYNDSIPVKIGANNLDFAWSGGLNYCQFSDIDFDFDGDMDLFIFDRSKDNIRLLEQINDNGTQKYRQVKNAKSFFPDGMKNRVALLDYDFDGKNDIFCYGIGGVKVYKNTGNSISGLSWQLITDLIYSDYDGSYTNLYVSAGDIPAYIDVDFDNDIDILTFNIGGDRMEYHQNQSQELYGHSDSLIFILKNQCWGKFTEDAITSEIILNPTDLPCGAGNVPNPQLHQNDNFSELNTKGAENLTRHAGSTILALDVDDSGVLDLVIGDVNLHNLLLLVNGGTTPNSNSAMISVDQNFPSNTTPVDISIFPAAFYVDVDFDSVKDLIVCPSAKSISENQRSILFYKNLGSNQLPNFSYRTNSFLQEEMIDVGTGSIPVFVDQNGDGLQDLLVGDFYRYKEPLLKESVIYNYRNTGTNNQPFFTFVESDFQNLTLENYGYRTVPAFGDVDSDGDQDLFLGLENGTLIFKENIAGASNPMNFASPVLSYADNFGNPISTDYYAFPQLFDLNEDGLLDLLLGNKTGEIKYYQNIGSATSPSFELFNDTLGGIDLATLSPDGYTAPHFFKYQDTIRLLLGGFDGKLRFYDDIEGNLNQGDTFNLISAAYKGIDVELFSSCYVNDIDSDGNLDLFVGGDLGGLYHLEHNLNGSLGFEESEKEANLKVIPNPAKNEIVIQYEKMEELSLKIYSFFGDLVFQTNTFTNEKIDISDLKSGAYVIQMKSENSNLVANQKLIIIQ
jgi:hypothetical protein